MNKQVLRGLDFGTRWHLDRTKACSPGWGCCGRAEVMSEPPRRKDDGLISGWALFRYLMQLGAIEQSAFCLVRQ